jgi:hypothetical protein
VLLSNQKALGVESTLANPVRYCNNERAWPITFHFATMRILQLGFELGLGVVLGLGLGSAKVEVPRHENDIH